MMPGLVIFVLTGLGLSQAAGLCADRLIAAVRGMAPWQGSLVLLMFAAAPLLLAAFVVLAVFVPPIAGLVIDLHCHDGICGQHAPVLPRLPAAAVLALLVLAPFSALALFGAVIAWRAAGFGSVLARLAEPGHDPAFQVLESTEAFAVSTGLLRRHVLVSRALLDSVTDEQLRVVIAHEQAHVCRFDNLRSLLAASATVLWPRRARRRLLDALHLAAEQACDEAVARALGAGVVAETILLLRERQLAGPEAPVPCLSRGVPGPAEDTAGTLAALDPTTAARLQALDTPPERGGALYGGVALATLLLAALQVVLFSQLLHHGLEAVLG